MQKKHVVIILVVAIIVMIGLIGLWIFQSDDHDAIKFKQEYESFNGEKTSSGKTYMSVEISRNNKFYYASFDEVMDVLSGTGVIYFGFPECPWCRNIVPVLLEAANETSIDKIYYFNALSMRDQRTLDADGNIVIEQEGTKEYYQLLEAMSSVLGPYEGLNDESILRLYFPTVVFVKDGKILSIHVGTLESQKDPYAGLTTDQREEIKKIYTDGIHAVLDDLCDMKC